MYPGEITNLMYDNAVLGVSAPYFRPTVYLAASWTRRQEIRGYANELLSHGIRVRSRWLEETECHDELAFEQFLQQNALIDTEDIRRSDVLVRFTDDLSAAFVPSRLATGARMFETGYAYALGKHVVVVGGNQCVFDRLPEITHVPDLSSLIQHLINWKE